MKQLTVTMLLLLLTYTTVSHAQICNPNITADAPDSRYLLKGDGTVRDKKTGLTWMRCALGQTWNGSTCVGLPKTYLWQNALQTAEIWGFAGQSDWRLPNQKELKSLLESRCYDPAMNLIAFPNPTPDDPIDNIPPKGEYWTSSPVASLSNDAWVVSFYYGYDYWYNKLNSDTASYVRLVRGGQ